jgi:hypothetical protein
VIIAGIAIVFRRREYKVALQASFPICAVFAVDTLQAARALKQDYFNYTDPLIITAGAVYWRHLDRLAYRIQSGGAYQARISLACRP